LSGEIVTQKSQTHPIITEEVIYQIEDYILESKLIKMGICLNIID
jgi:hypothetical protein